METPLTRLVEVEVREESSLCWHEIHVHDGSPEGPPFTQSPLVDSSKLRAGGEGFQRNNGSKFLVYWRAVDCMIELVISGITVDIHSQHLKLNTQSDVITTHIGLFYLHDILRVLFVTQSAVCHIEINLHTLHRGSVSVCKNSTYPHSVVSSGGFIRHVQTQYNKHNDSLLYHITTSTGNSYLIHNHRDSCEKVELKDSGIRGFLSQIGRRSGIDTSYYPHCSVFIKSYILFVTAADQIKIFNTRTHVNEYTSTLGRDYGLGVSMIKFDYGDVTGFTLQDSHNNIRLFKFKMDGSLSVELIASLNHSTYDIISHNVIGEDLFLTYRNENGQYEIKRINIADICCSNGRIEGEYMLVEVWLNNQIKSAPDVLHYQDPREVFCDEVFRGSTKFLIEAIVKAVLIFDESFNAERKYTLSELEKEACRAVSLQVRSSVTSDELTNTEYRELQYNVWCKFYSNLTQYQTIYIQPVNVVCFDKSLPIVLVKQRGVSYLRMCEPCEQQYLFPSDPLDPTQTLDQDVVTMATMLQQLRTHIEGFEDVVYRGIIEQKSVKNIIEEITEALLDSPSHETLNHMVQSHVQNITRLVESLDVFRYLLNTVSDLERTNIQQIQADVSDDDIITHTFNSTGRSILTQSFTDVCARRFSLTCSILVYIEYMTYLAQQAGTLVRMEDELKVLTNSLRDLLRTYAVLLWISKLELVKHTDDISTVLSETLKITNNTTIHGVLTDPVSPGSSSILEDFLSGVGGVKVQAIIKQLNEEPLDFNNRCILLSRASQLALWPLTSDVMFCEYLVARGSSGQLSQYCQLVDSWCLPSLHERKFLLGHSYLLNGEAVRAYSCFQAALYDMFNEQTTPDDDELNQQQVDFSIKIVNLFEELGFSEQLIQMAHQAVKFSDQHQPALWTKIFKHNLELKRYNDSYRAMLQNPDQKRRSDCLHQFITSLCDEPLFETLVSYPYKDMETQADLRFDVVNILTSKARSIDLNVKNYYDLLFAFHIVNNDQHSAAHVMYECAERLSRELTGLSSLQKQGKCYLSCMSALKTLPAKSAYITPDLFNQEIGGSFYKRTARGSQKALYDKLDCRILTLSDIEKEYMLINMSLRLAAVTGHDPLSGSSVRLMDVSDIVTQLCKVGLYDECINVCQTFQLSLQPVFDSLTYRCMKGEKTTHNNIVESDVSSKDDYKWLTYNEIKFDTDYIGPSGRAWKLLRFYLNKYEELTKYHKIICNKLISNNYQLPEWVITSYQSRNVAELVRLYVIHDEIEPAVRLLSNYLTDLTTTNSVKYGIEGPLSGTMKPCSVWVPYTLINQLTGVLEQYQHDPYYNNLYEKLTSSRTLYENRLREVSNAC